MLYLSLKLKSIKLVFDVTPDSLLQHYHGQPGTKTYVFTTPLLMQIDLIKLRCGSAVFLEGRRRDKALCFISVKQLNNPALQSVNPENHP